MFLVSGLGALATIGAGIAAITRPLDSKIENVERLSESRAKAVEERLERIELRTGDSLKKLDDKLQIEIKGQADLAKGQQENLRLLQKDAEDRHESMSTQIEARAGSNAEQIRLNQMKIAVLEERLSGIAGEEKD